MIIYQAKTTTKGVWKALAKRHLEGGLRNRLFLMSIFFNSQMSSNETMEQHVNKLSVMVEELDAIGIKVPPKVKVLIFLMSLPNSYQLLVTSLECNESTKLIREVVTTRLLNEEFMTL
jgi:hypothetical protein